VPTLMSRIARRGRDFESKITSEYLGQLNALYDSWIDGFSLCPVLTVPADDIDFVAHPRYIDLIVEKVEEKLSGQEQVLFTTEDILSYL
jgi:deoxyadenosine/deoxycytidine kinase